MDKNSNSYTFIFSGILVVVVASLLASAAIGLQPLQEKNIKNEKMKNILNSVGIMASAEDAASLFSKYITQQLVLNSNGELVEEGTEAFDIDMKVELDKAKKGMADKQLFPLFVCEKKDSTFYIIPMRGNGLWGPIWGYVSFEQDMNSVYGATFDHKGETPGLGAEISTAAFQAQFKGEKIFNESGDYVSILVKKGGAEPDNLHAVDAISGGTITSDGVSEMLKRTFGSYVNYFKGKIDLMNSVNQQELALPSDTVVIN